MNTHTDNLKISRIKSVDDSFIQQLNELLDEGMVWDLEEGQKFLSNNDNALFVAFENDRAVGFLTAHRLQRFDKRKAEVLLYEIGVHEDFRKKGIGKSLIKAVKQWAREVGADEVWVLTYNSNEAAMALYKSEAGEEDAPGTRMFTYKIEIGE